MALKALTWLTHGRKLYAPGDDLSDLPEYAQKSMLEHGEATESLTEVKKAVDAELVRQEQVRLEQQGRSRPREHNEQK